MEPTDQENTLINTTEQGTCNGSDGKMLSLHAQSPGFDFQYWINQVYWLMPVNLVSAQEVEAEQEFKVIFGYIVSPKPVWATGNSTYHQQQTEVKT